MYRLFILAVAVAALSACAIRPTPGSGYATTAQLQRGCANLGIDPGSAQFSSCVDNMQATLNQDARIDH